MRLMVPPVKAATSSRGRRNAYLLAKERHAETRQVSIGVKLDVADVMDGMIAGADQIGNGVTPPSPISKAHRGR